MDASKVLALANYPSIGKFMTDWNKSWRESLIFLEWLQKWNEKSENWASAVDKHLGQKFTESDGYKELLKLNLDSVTLVVFRDVFLDLGCGPSEPFGIVDEHIAANDRHKGLILESLKKWMNLEFFQGKAEITNLLVDVADPAKIHHVLLKLFPEIFGGVSNERDRTSYLICVETFLRRTPRFKKLNLQNAYSFDRLKFAEGLLATYMENFTLKFFKEINFLKCLSMWWMQIMLEYDNVQIVDLSTSFASGLAVCAFIDKFQKGSINYQSLKMDDPIGNWNTALNNASMLFGIQPLFQAEDVAELVENKSMLIIFYAFQCLVSAGGRLYEKQLLCPVCDERATDLTDLHRHLESHSCTSLSAFWFDEIMLEQHKPLEMPMTCDSCNVDFHTAASYGDHDADDHNKVFCWFCHCHHCSDSKEDYLEHVSTHIPLLIENCDECKQSFFKIFAHGPDHLKSD